ncbi:nuclear transport factor 2 family protein [Sphingobium nicotianae]|uniref:Nuclear transport factor 2 family protein n=1 Tax=Sphingobium nicotianae TaxID=2782607 RepID=A0A9X1DD80_9SPHN|nr:nuclear transport factor 2 family protein [Sphingobium nicotianae]MBT2187368.1 nuclear transport factor 2 family protein [Sphingobium nicotianae]
MTDAARLQELEDKEAIRQIFTDYARYLDNYDYAGYASLFAREGVFGTSVGVEAITKQMADYVERVTGAKAEGRFRDAVHLMSNPHIEIDGDTARIDITWCYMTRDADEVPTVFQMGHYLDDLVREDGKWKIAKHTVNRSMGRAQLEPPHPSRFDALQAQVQELKDKEEIRQIFTDYARFLDTGNMEGYASLFASNGWMKASLGEATGPVAILELLNKYRDVSKGRKFPRSVHIVNNHDINLDGDKADVKVTWFYLTLDPDGVPMILQGGHYIDKIVREDGKWKLVSHDIDRFFGRAAFEPAPVTRLDRIEQRLKDVEDKEAIVRLCMRMQDALDGRDLVDYGNCFTKDGVWSGVTGRYVGPKAITEFFEKVCKPWETPGHTTYHTTSDFVIDLDGDTARARSQWRHIMRGEKDAPVIVHHGHYDDEFRRTPEGWLFTKRAAFGDIPYYEPKFQLIGAAKPEEIEA